MTRTPPRLYVLMRPDCDQALVLRQGPTKVFCTLGWNLGTDKLVVGQWCKHKIYVERCDISSTGKYFVYFALDGKWRSEAKGAFTALAFAPYVKALKLWPQGHTWGGGGLFYRDRTTAPPDVARRWTELDDFDGNRLAPHNTDEERLARDGWTRPGRSGWRKAITSTLSLERKNVSTRARFAIVDGETVSARPSWTWADVDAKRKRLLWAEGGVLYQARIGARGLREPDTIFDARDMTFEAIAAPYPNKTIIAGA